jgi:hypothetical protein
MEYYFSLTKLMVRFLKSSGCKGCNLQMIGLSSVPSYAHRLKGKTQLDTTQLQFLNLDELEKRYGDRWPQVRGRIIETCESFISRRIRPEDLLLRAANGFLILPDPNREEPAEAFTRRIKLDLEKFFLGTDYLKSLRLSAETKNIALQDLFSALESETFERAEADHAAARSSVDPPAAPLPDFSLRFESIWTMRTGHVALQRILPFSMIGGVGSWGHKIPPSSGGDAMVMEFDRQVLISAAAAARANDAPSRCALAVPVHFRTLASVKHRLPYMACFKEHAHGTDGLMLHVRGLPMDAPASTITETTAVARNMTRRILCEADALSMRPDRFDDARVDIFTCAAPADAGLMERREVALRVFNARLRRSGAMAALTDCRSPRHVSAGVSAGFAHFAGEAVDGLKRQPEKAYRLDPLGSQGA